jgi:Cu+-exporting ATPase
VISKSLLKGTAAALIMLSIYFTVLTLVSGWNFAQNQFSNYWYFVVSLAVGFGIQIGLFVYLRNLIKDGQVSSKVLGVTGTTSTAAMVSCCTHYLANLLPVIGAAGLVTFVAQYQVQLFWVALLFNIGGIAYMASKVTKFKVHA